MPRLAAIGSGESSMASHSAQATANRSTSQDGKNSTEGPENETLLLSFLGPPVDLCQDLSWDGYGEWVEIDPRKIRTCKSG